MDPAELLRAIGDIDEELLERSEKPRRRWLIRIAADVAALLLVAGVGVGLIIYFGKRDSEPEQNAYLPEQTELSATELPVTETPSPAASTIEPFITVIPTLPPGATEIPGWKGDSFEGQGDYTQFTSADELVHNADLVVRVRIVDSVCAYGPMAFRVGPDGSYVPREDAPSTLRTIYGIQVLEVYKGGEAAKRIKRVMIPGGIVDGVIRYYGCPDYAQYVRGGDCVLFLSVPELGETWIWEDMAFPVGFSEDRCDIEYDGGGEGVIKCRFPEVTFEWLRGLDSPTI